MMRLISVGFQRREIVIGLLASLAPAPGVVVVVVVGHLPERRLWPALGQPTVLRVQHLLSRLARHITLQDVAVERDEPVSPLELVHHQLGCVSVAADVQAGGERLGAVELARLAVVDRVGSHEPGEESWGGGADALEGDVVETIPAAVHDGETVAVDEMVVAGGDAVGGARGERDAREALLNCGALGGTRGGRACGRIAWGRTDLGPTWRGGLESAWRQPRSRRGPRRPRADACIPRPCTSTGRSRRIRAPSRAAARRRAESPAAAASPTASAAPRPPPRPPPPPIPLPPCPCRPSRVSEWTGAATTGRGGRRAHAFLRAAERCGGEIRENT